MRILLLLEWFFLAVIAWVLLNVIYALITADPKSFGDKFFCIAKWLRRGNNQQEKQK